MAFGIALLGITAACQSDDAPQPTAVVDPAVDLVLRIFSKFMLQGRSFDTTQILRYTGSDRRCDQCRRNRKTKKRFFVRGRDAMTVSISSN